MVTRNELTFGHYLWFKNIRFPGSLRLATGVIRTLKIRPCFPHWQPLSKQSFFFKSGSIPRQWKKYEITLWSHDKASLICDSVSPTLHCTSVRFKGTLANIQLCWWVCKGSKQKINVKSGISDPVLKLYNLPRCSCELLYKHWAKISALAKQNVT